MKTRDRVLLAVGAALALASECNAFQSDVHYGTTFAIAVATGWTWDQASVIAGANQSTDENIDTRPSIQISERSSSDPAQSHELEVNEQLLAQVLGRIAATAQYPPGLSLQDFYFHCFSRNKDAVRRRNQDVVERLNFLATDSARAIDASRRDGTEISRMRALVSIGVYLHCQQDSWAHSGYGGEPLGHVKHGTVPDNPAHDPELTTSALRESEQQLIAFRERFAPSTSRTLTESARRELLAGLAHPAARAMSDFERATCNTSLTEYWIRRTLVRSGRISEARDNLRDTMIEPRTIAVGKPGGWRLDPATGKFVPRIALNIPRERKEVPSLTEPASMFVAFLTSVRCDQVFSSVYADDPHVAARDRAEACVHTAQPCPALPFPRAVLPPAKYPVLVPAIGGVDAVVNDKGTLKTLN